MSDAAPSHRMHLSHTIQMVEDQGGDVSDLRLIWRLAIYAAKLLRDNAFSPLDPKAELTGRVWASNETLLQQVRQ